MVHPLFKWFGSKWLSSKTLPPPEYGLICEPYAGGAGYSLRYASHKIQISETDPHLVRLWPWLIDEATETMIREIPINTPEGVDIRSLGLNIGQQLLLKTWQRTNNVGDCWTISPWGNKPGQWTANTRARVSEEISAVKHWKFVRNWVAEMPNKPATWFIDPPYQFNYGYRQPEWPEARYEELGGICRALQGQVIVCEAECPKTGRRPNWLPFRSWGNRITSRRKTNEHHHSKELLWEKPLDLG